MVIAGAFLFGVYKSLSFAITQVVSFFNQSDEVIHAQENIEKTKEIIGTVILDPGHGGVDAGAKKGTLYEKDIDLKVAKMIQEELENNGIKVIMTRETDETLDPNNKISDLKQRAGMSEKYQADYFVSIHVNAFEDSDDVSGFEIYTKNDASQELAKGIASYMEALNLSKNRGIIDGKHLQVLRDNTVASVLIELGYINGKDYDYLSNDIGLEKLSKAISEGIIKTVENK